MAGKVRLTDSLCPNCNCEGFYFRLPPNANGPPGNDIVSGELSGLNGTVRRQTGVFEK